MGTVALIVGAVLLCLAAGLGVALLLYMFAGPDWEGE